MLEMPDADGYRVDIVLCIDSTASMNSILNTVKAGALAFHDRVQTVMARRDMTVSSLRVRVIAFRDFGDNRRNAIERTPFLDLPEDAEKFRAFIDGLRATGGGDLPESGLEALALAVQSPWTAADVPVDGPVDAADDTGTGDDLRRHFIVLFTDDAAHPLGKHTPGFARDRSAAKRRAEPKRSWFAKRKSAPASATSLEPEPEPEPEVDVYPGSLEELHRQWGQGDAEGAVMNQSAKRLLIFAPEKEPWPEIADTWDKTMFVPSTAGAGLTDVALDEVISTIARSV